MNEFKPGHLPLEDDPGVERNEKLEQPMKMSKSTKYDSGPLTFKGV